MKHFILTSALALSCLGLHAQSEEGIRYALPMTAMHFTVTFEKTVYTPGEYAEYTRRFLRKDVPPAATDDLPHPRHQDGAEGCH